MTSSRPDQLAALLRVAVGEAGPVVPDAADWERWPSLARSERVTPLLFQLVDTVATDLDDVQRERIRNLQRDALSHVVRLEHHLISVVPLFAAHGIRSAVLKGAATAHLDYPDPSWREFADIDVLVDPTELERATALLLDSGWVQRYALPTGHEQYTHALTFMREAVELDLHQRLAHRGLGLLVPTGDLLDRVVSFEIAGVKVHALGVHDRLIHAALHSATSRGPGRHLSSVTDVLLLAASHPELAVDTLERAERWRVRPLVERAVVDAYVSAQLPVPGEWTRAMSAPIRARDRLVEHAYLGPNRRAVAEELACLRLLPTWRDRWLYVRGYFTIGPEYAAQHGRSGLRAQVGYLVSKLRTERR